MTISELFVKIGADTTGFKREMDSLSKEINARNAELKKLGAGAFSNITSTTALGGLRKELDALKAKKEGLLLTDQQAVTAINRQINAYESLIGKVERAGIVAKKSLVQAAQEVGAKFEQAGRVLTVGLTAPITALGVAAVKAAADLERARVAYTGLLGSASKADKFIADLQQYAASTPFQFTELQQSSRLLLTFGISAEKVIPTIKTLGDAIAAMGGGQEEFNGVARAIGQIQAKGKASAEELLQLAERGIPAYDILAKKLNLTGDQVANIGNQGIKSSVAIDALMEGLNDRFAGAAQKQAETITGLFSTLKDNVTIALQGIGDTIVKEFGLKDLLKDAITTVQGLAKEFNSLSPAVKKFILVGSGLLAAVGPALLALGTFSTTVLPVLIAGFTALTGPVGIVIAALAGITAAYIALKDYGETMSKEEALAKPLDQLLEKRKQLEQELPKLKKEIENATANSTSGIKTSNRTNEEYERAKQELKNVRQAIREKQLAEKEERFEAAKSAAATKGQTDELENQKFTLAGLKKELSDLQTAREKANYNTKEFVNLTDQIAAKQREIDKIESGRIGRIASLESKIKDLNLALSSTWDKRQIAEYQAEIAKTERELEDLKNLRPFRNLNEYSKNDFAISISPQINTYDLEKTFNELPDKINVKKLGEGLGLDYISDQFRLLEEESKVFSEGFGSNFDVNSEKVRILTNEIQNLIEKGFSALSPEVQALKEKLDEIDSPFENLKTSLSTFGDSIIDTFVQGEEGIKGFGKTFLNEMRKILKGYLAEAVAATVTKALKNAAVPFPLNLVLAAGAGAAAAALFNSAIPKFAAGGLAYGPTLGLMGEYPNAANNPEVIAPLSKLKDLLGGGNGGVVEFKIKGDQLYGVLQNHQTKRGRLY